MSKLKVVTLYGVDALNNDIERQYYHKSEADKVIAELKEGIEEQKRLRNMALASVPNVLKVMKIIQHHKYKRCLAMAKLCHWKMGVFIYKKEKSDFYYRWYKRWLELAEKFKEGNK